MSPRRDPKYLAWIRTLPCLVCGSTWKTEASHTGSHGMSQKSSDRSCIPLCARHHRTANDSYHKLGARAFEEKHRLNLRKIVGGLNEKPHIRIENGAFVAHCGGERYVLGLVCLGVRSAVRKAVWFWCDQVGDRNFGFRASSCDSNDRKSLPSISAQTV